MSSSSRSLQENLANVGQPRRPDPYISANQEQIAGGESGLVLPTSTEIQVAWEEVAGSEEELEAEEGPVAEQEPELEEEQEAEEGAEAEEAQSPPPITGSSLQEKISEDIDLLFSPATAKRFKERCNSQRGSPSTVASKKPKVSRGAIGEGGTTITRAKAIATRRRAKKRE
jgi:hypothetical protein